MDNDRNFSLSQTTQEQAQEGYAAGAYRFDPTTGERLQPAAPPNQQIPFQRMGGFGMGYVKLWRTIAIIISCLIFIAGMVIAINMNNDRKEGGVLFIFLGIILAFLVYLGMDLFIKVFENIARIARESEYQSKLLVKLLEGKKDA